VGSRLPRPYHFRARIQSFQALAAPFPSRRETGAACAGGRGAPAARFFPRFLSFQSFERRKISLLVHRRRRIRQSPTKLVRAALPGAEAGCRSGLAGKLGHGGLLEWRRAFEQHTTILLLRKKKLENLEGSHLAKTHNYREKKLNIGRRP
jgi:hypothetical protein